MIALLGLVFLLFVVVMFGCLRWFILVDSVVHIYLIVSCFRLGYCSGVAMCGLYVLWMFVFLFDGCFRYLRLVRP